VADAARREWEEATAAKADAAQRARAELDQRGPARWDEAKPEAAAEQPAEKEARDWAAIEQAGIDELVNHAKTQAELEATAAAERAEVDDADIEI
jgi:hypothetical protein